MGGTAAEDDPLNRGLAAGTGLAFSIVNTMQPLECPLFPIGIDIVVQRTAAVTDGPAENQLDRVGEGFDLVLA